MNILGAGRAISAINRTPGGILETNRFNNRIGQNITSNTKDARRQRIARWVDMTNNKSSTLIREIDYNADTGELTLDFTNGHSYRYYGVPENVIMDFAAVPSLGQYYNIFIKNNYTYVRLR